MNSENESLERWDRDHLWHPFTPMQAYAARFDTATKVPRIAILIAGVGIVSAALLYVFLRFTKLGFAVRATAQHSASTSQPAQCNSGLGFRSQSSPSPRSPSAWKN